MFFSVYFYIYTFILIYKYISENFHVTLWQSVDSNAVIGLHRYTEYMFLAPCIVI
jgi:hypothetical protein